MKTNLDDIFFRHLTTGGFVIAADMGYFPKARLLPNFIDVGNNEASAGSLVEGLLSQGKNVFLYDVCGYILKNSYTSLFARNNSYHEKKGKLTVFGWGCGFAYDGCLLGHYPFDDIMIASLLGLKVYQPSQKEEFEKALQERKDSYIRLFNLKEYPYKEENQIGEYYLIAQGWLLGLLQKYLKYGYFKKGTVLLPYTKGIENNLNLDTCVYYSDQYYEPLFEKFKFVKHPLNVNTSPEKVFLYTDKKSCLKSWFGLDKLSENG